VSEEHIAYIFRVQDGSNHAARNDLRSSKLRQYIPLKHEFIPDYTASHPKRYYCSTKRGLLSKFLYICLVSPVTGMCESRLKHRNNLGEE
jgi:hypothetical protein